MDPKPTRDYSIFKNHPSNREIDKGNLLRITASIGAKNLLKFRPIVVNSDFQIIDGQHRFEAAKSLGIEIWYIIDQSSCLEDMILLNVNQKTWDLEDYLHHHCSLANPNYINLKKFMETEAFDCRQSLKFMDFASHTNLGPFKNGSFLFPEGQKYAHLMNEVYKFKTIVSIIQKMKLNSHEIWTKSKFKSALITILKIPELDFDTFKEKITINLDKVRLCANSCAYLNMLKDIYNWKNRDPLT